jgi:hypothetical protein
LARNHLLRASIRESNPNIRPSIRIRIQQSKPYHHHLSQNLQLHAAAFSAVPLTPTLATSKPTHTISPHSRTAQIARHFSGSSSSSDNNSPTTTTTMASQYQVRKVGAPNTLEHRIFIEKDGVPISPFHDIPLYANEQQTILNMVVEIPRWTNGKLEASYLHC